jgi:hypothetical protein
MVQNLPAQQIAFEGLNHFGHSPFGSIDIPQQLLDAVPPAKTVKIAAVAFIEEFTMLLAHVFFVLPAIFDSHPLPSLTTFRVRFAFSPENRHTKNSRKKTNIGKFANAK